MILLQISVAFSQLKMKKIPLRDKVQLWFIISIIYNLTNPLNSSKNLPWIAVLEPHHLRLICSGQIILHGSRISWQFYIKIEQTWYSSLENTARSQMAISSNHAPLIQYEKRKHFPFLILFQLLRKNNMERRT